MISVGKNQYKTLTPPEGALYVIAAEQAISELGLPSWFTEGVFDKIKSNISARAQSEFYVDPTSREEITGLVRAAMGENDHMHAAGVELKRFVVGLLQTNEETIQSVSETIVDQ
jgi:hypothetical protein